MNNAYIFDLIAKIVQDSAPPTVTFVEPPDGLTVIEGTTLPVQVEAVEDVGIERVEFLVNGQVAATDTAAPFVSGIQLPTEGQVTVQARAIDRAGNTGHSPPVVLDVVDDQPPTVEIITAPPHGAAVIGGQMLTIHAEALDDRHVARVDPEQSTPADGHRGHRLDRRWLPATHTDRPKSHRRDGRRCQHAGDPPC